jgi:hypothetical protein
LTAKHQNGKIIATILAEFVDQDVAPDPAQAMI